MVTQLEKEAQKIKDKRNKIVALVNKTNKAVFLHNLSTNSGRKFDIRYSICTAGNLIELDISDIMTHKKIAFVEVWLLSSYFNNGYFQRLDMKKIEELENKLEDMYKLAIKYIKLNETEQEINY